MPPELSPATDNGRSARRPMFGYALVAVAPSRAASRGRAVAPDGSPRERHGCAPGDVGMQGPGRPRPADRRGDAGIAGSGTGAEAPSKTRDGAAPPYTGRQQRQALASTAPDTAPGPGNVPSRHTYQVSVRSPLNSLARTEGEDPSGRKGTVRDRGTTQDA